MLKNLGAVTLFCHLIKDELWDNSFTGVAHGQFFPFFKLMNYAKYFILKTKSLNTERLFR